MSSPRPRSVTLGCVYGGLGGFLTAISLIEVLRGWGSLEMQEALRSTLDQVGSGVEVDAVLGPLRWVVMVLLVGAIAATVFSFYAARGHQASRIGLTVLAGVAAVTFVFSGVAGVLPAVLGGLIVYLLWSAPSREWFAVVNGHTPLSLGAAPTVSSTPPPAVAPHRQDALPAQDPAAAPVPPVYDPAQYPQHAPAPTTAPAGRPRAVTTALLIAGIGSALGAAFSGLILVVLLALRDQVVEQYSTNDTLQRQLDQTGVTADQMVSLGAWLFGVWVVVSVAGLVATGWAATGRRSGWWALLVATAVMAATAALGLPVGLLWLVGAIIVIVQLCKPESKAWFRRT